jgi:hypothetical protein
MHFELSKTMAVLLHSANMYRKAVPQLVDKYPTPPKQRQSVPWSLLYCSTAKQRHSGYE